MGPFADLWLLRIFNSQVASLLIGASVSDHWGSALPHLFTALFYFCPPNESFSVPFPSEQQSFVHTFAVTCVQPLLFSVSPVDLTGRFSLA